MTFIATTTPSTILTIRSGQCTPLRSQNPLNYDVGKNQASDLFIRITNYGGTATYSHDWFAIIDLAQSFTSANGSPVKSFEPFDNSSNPLPVITNHNPSAFLKAVLIDAIS